MFSADLDSETLMVVVTTLSEVMPEYITYCMDSGLHPNLWSTNANGIYQWWLQRSAARITASSTIRGPALPCMPSESVCEEKFIEAPSL